MGSLGLDEGCVVAVVGSLGRREITRGSDGDFLLLSLDDRGFSAGARRASRDTVAKAMKDADLQPPNPDGAFAKVVRLHALKNAIGGDAESNSTLTVRMLLLLESCALVNESGYRNAIDELRGVYLAKGVAGEGPKSHRPPRFLVNDVERYWRTMCVDYEGKLRGQSGEGWALRNAKLRTVRKMLYAGGLIPLVRCAELESAEIGPFLDRQFRMPPSERVAEAFLHCGQADVAARSLTAYSDFLGKLDNPSWRDAVKSLKPGQAANAEFKEAKALGRDFDEGLRTLITGSSLRAAFHSFVIL